MKPTLYPVKKDGIFMDTFWIDEGHKANKFMRHVEHMLTSRASKDGTDPHHMWVTDLKSGARLLRVQRL
jgi:hypothetical protein